MGPGPLHLLPGTEELRTLVGGGSGHSLLPPQPGSGRLSIHDDVSLGWREGAQTPKYGACVDFREITILQGVKDVVGGISVLRPRWVSSGHSSGSRLGAEPRPAAHLAGAQAVCTPALGFGTAATAPRSKGPVLPGRATRRGLQCFETDGEDHWGEVT